MSDAFEILLNGQLRSFSELVTGSTLDQIVRALELQSDRIAVERNGEIVPRTQWPTTAIQHGDKLEIVHFVGGGTHFLPAMPI
jgi:thiamine biosynthesis protein ThiS